MVTVKQWGTLCDGDIIIQSYSEDDLNGVLKVLQNFFSYEPACIGAEINLPESKQARLEFELLCRTVLKNGLSLIARYKPTNEIVGVIINTFDVKCPSDEISYFNEFQSDNALSFFNFMDQIYKRGNLFEKYQTDCKFDIMIIGTLPTFGKRGIAKALCQYSLELAKELKMGNLIEILPVSFQNKRPQIASSIFTSKYSQKVGEIFGFEQVLEVPYTECSFKGKTYAERIGSEHPSCILAVKRI